MNSSDTIRLLLVDNYDSFTYNLFQLLGSFENIEVDVRRNDKVTLQEIVDAEFDAIVLSPGPGNPENDRDFGICKEIITQLKEELPILGICLGHQGMGYLLLGSVIRAKRILHGKTSEITHTNTGIFEGIPQEIKVARYHSLILDKNTLPDSLTVTAQTEEEEIMAIQHQEYPLYGLQFHPESFMTEYGREMMSNFLNLIKISQPQVVEVHQ